MKRFFSIRSRVVLLIAVLVALLIVVFSILAPNLHPARRGAEAALSPVRSGVAAIARQAERFYNYAFTYDRLEAENDALKAQLAEIEQETRDIDALEAENERLYALLELQKEHADYDLQSAYVVGRSSNQWASELTLSRGSAAGLSEGMCVITEYGEVVGVITDTGLNWATVTTILDASSEIGASVGGYTGVVQGAWQSAGSDSLRLTYLSSEASLKNGDAVITTGTSCYPAGLTLGRISGTAVDAAGVAQYAVLTPAANLDGLEQVFIVTNYTWGQ